MNKIYAGCLLLLLCLFGGKTTYGQTLLNSAVSNSGAISGNYTLGYTFTPNTSITVVSFRRLFGTTISIWNSAGTFW